MTIERMSDERLRYLTRWIDDDDERELFAELHRARAAASIHFLDQYIEVADKLRALMAERDALRADLDALVAALPRCSFSSWTCPELATSYDPDTARMYCDEHSKEDEDGDDRSCERLEWAPILRRLAERGKGGKA